MDVLANVVVLVHLTFFVFVAGGFVATLIGVMQRKPWAFHPGFRILHFSAVLLVIVEDWLAIDCPLNRLETQLRPMTTDANPGFLEYLLHHTLPEYTLDILYLTMGSVLLVLMLVARPRFRSLCRG